MKYRLTRAAEADVRRVLKQTGRLFGARQVSIYNAIMIRGAEMIASAPFRPASVAREDVGKGLRSFHLAHVRKRRQSA